METKEFLQSVLGDDGLYCLFAAKGKLPPVQDFYENIDELHAEARSLDAAGYDTYYALATFDTEKRSKNNVRQIRSLFLDIDCGEGKDYSTQTEAITALQNFCKTVKLPRPTMVNSGRGVHVYWRLEKPVTYDVWFPVASRLKAVCAAKSFNVDHVVTSDGARILRIPDTHNYKDSPPKPTGVIGGIAPPISIDEFDELLEEHVGSNTLPTLFSKQYTVDDDATAKLAQVDENRTNSFKKIMQKTLKGKGCDQIQIIASDQVNCPEPLWRAGLSICKPCEDAETAAKNISKRHPSYSEKETLRKMYETQGPYKCDKFDAINPDVCPECPHWGKIKSPIVLGSAVKEATASDNVVPVAPVEGELLPANNTALATVTIPDFPKPYFRGKTGGVYYRVVDEDGNTDDIKVHPYDLYAVDHVYSIEDGHSFVFRHHPPHNPMQEFIVPLAHITNSQRFREVFSFWGVAITPAAFKDITDYVMKWVEHLQKEQQFRKAHLQFGWTENHESFVLGGDEYTTSGEILANPPSTSTAQYIKMFEPKGTFEGWREAMKFLAQPGLEVQQFTVCAALGSVLMEFIDNVPGAGLHLYSTGTGHGKTTALFAGNSVWGDYSKLTIQAEDTMASTMHRGQVLKNLPLFVDEVTNNEPKALSNFVLQVTRGNERNRMEGSSNKERERGAPWSLMSVTTGNVSIIQQVGQYKRSARAEAARFLEINVEKVNFDSKKVTDDFNKLLANNYGHAGPIFIKRVMQDVAFCKTIVWKVQQAMDSALKLTAQQRFHSAGAAVAIAAGLLARQWRIIDFDMERLRKWSLGIVRQNMTSEAFVENTGIQDIIGEYLLENHGSTLYIASTEDRRTHTDDEKTAVPMRNPNQRIAIRMETDTKLASLAVAPFKAWCSERQVNFQELINSMINELGAKRKTVRLTKGLPVTAPPVKCIQIVCDFIDEQSSTDV